MAHASLMFTDVVHFIRISSSNDRFNKENKETWHESSHMGWDKNGKGEERWWKGAVDLAKRLEISGLFLFWGLRLQSYDVLYLVCPNRVINWWCTSSHLWKWTCCSGKSSSFDSTQLLHDLSTKSSLPASRQCWREDSARLMPANRTSWNILKPCRLVMIANTFMWLDPTTAVSWEI